MQPQGPITVTQSFITTVTAAVTATDTYFSVTSTSTSTIVQSATVTAHAGSFALYAVGAPFDGYYLSLVEDGSFFTVSLAKNSPSLLPSFFKLENQNIVYVPNSYIATSDEDSFNYLLFKDQASGSVSINLACAVFGGFLRCGTARGATAFFGCLDESGEQLAPTVYFFAQGDPTPDGCFQIELQQHVVA
jgi:hypothetical protein